MSDGTIRLTLNPEKFFQKRFRKAAESELNVSDTATAYLSRTFQKTLAQPIGSSEPIAELYLKGTETAHCSTLGRRNLQTVGDTSLFRVGLFWLSLSRKPVDVNYYSILGRMAYFQLEDEPFNELSQKFQYIADLLTKVGLEWHLTNDRNVLRLYEVWTRSGNRVIRDALLAKGMPLPEIGVNRVQ